MSSPKPPDAGRQTTTPHPTEGPARRGPRYSQAAPHQNPRIKPHRRASDLTTHQTLTSDPAPHQSPNVRSSQRTSARASGPTPHQSPTLSLIHRTRAASHPPLISIPQLAPATSAKPGRCSTSAAHCPGLGEPSVKLRTPLSQVGSMCRSSGTTSRLGRDRRVRTANSDDSGATSRLGRKAGAQHPGSGETARRSNPSTCANVGDRPCPKRRFSPKAGSCAEKGPLSAPARPEFSQAGTMCRECRATSRLGRTSRQPVGPPLPRRDDAQPQRCAST